MCDSVVQKPILDQVIVTVKTYGPKSECEREFQTIDKAIEFLWHIKNEVV